MDIKFISCTYFCLLHPMIYLYAIITVRIYIHTCRYSGRCKLCEPEGSLCQRVCVRRFLLFIPFCPHACEPVWEHGAAVSGNVDLSNMGMDCYNHWVITPTSSTPTTVYNMTVYLPLCSAYSTFLSPTMSLLGVTVCLYVSVETFDCFHFGGESFVVILFCFYFVKLMIHIVLEPPATIKTAKSYSCSFFFSSFLIDILHNGGSQQNDIHTLQVDNTFFEFLFTSYIYIYI